MNGSVKVVMSPNGAIPDKAYETFVVSYSRGELQVTSPRTHKQ